MRFESRSCMRNQVYPHRDLIVEAKLPRRGQRRSSSYEGEGYAIVRHEDTATVIRALERILETVRVELG